MSDLEHTPDFHTVTWRGERFVFTAQQAAIVGLLIRHRGRALSGSWLLAQVESNSPRLWDVFKRKGGAHPCWNTFVVSPAKGIYMIPPEIPPPPPGDPLSACQTPAVVQGNEALTAEGRSMEIRRRLESILSDLAFRQHVGVVVGWGALVATATSHDEIMAMADELEVVNLVAGLDHLINYRMGSLDPLASLEEDLDALANAWSRIEDQEDQFLKQWLLRLPSKRRETTCPAEFSPGGLEAIGLTAEDQAKAIGWPRVRAEGDVH